MRLFKHQPPALPQLLALGLSLCALVVQSWLQGADLGWPWRGLLGQGQCHVNKTVWAWLWKRLEGDKSGPHVQRNRLSLHRLTRSFTGTYLQTHLNCRSTRRQSPSEEKKTKGSSSREPAANSTPCPLVASRGPTLLRIQPCFWVHEWELFKVRSWPKKMLDEPGQEEV